MMNTESGFGILAGDEFHWVSAQARSADNAAGFLSISARGRVTSVKQDGQEMLPTRLADLMTAEPMTRGIYGGLVLFLLFTGGLLLKRAFDNLAKAVLPD
jgi:hypothetical protein